MARIYVETVRADKHELVDSVAQLRWQVEEETVLYCIKVPGVEGSGDKTCVPMKGDISEMGSRMRVASSCYLTRWRKGVDVNDKSAVI